MWATSFSVGAAIGPLVGGLMLQEFWWGSVFLLAVPVMALLLVVGPRLLPEYKDPAPGRFDVASAAMSVAAVLAVIYGVKGIAAGDAGPTALAAIAAGLLTGTAFIRRQRRLADPLLDLGLFRRPAFSAALGVNTLGIFVAGGAFLFIAQYLQLVVGLSPLEAGLWTLPSAGAFIVGSMVVPKVAQRTGPAFGVVGGLLISATGLALLTQVDAAGGIAVLVAGSVLTDFGLAFVVTLGTDLIVGSAPPERAGAASAISETGAELGGAMGVALLGSIGAAVYRSQLEIGADVPEDAAHSVREGLGGAASVADQLPPGLMEAAGEAFTRGFQVAAGVTAAMVLGAALLVAVVLRERSPVVAGSPCPDAG